ncbi:MAG: signal peptidase II [Actinobacteria bacterium]|nr:signal peptidase II [Actinomycetota bacterium]
MARSSRRLGLALALAAGVFVVDQASKGLVRHEAARLPLQVVGGVRIDLNYNSGISFSRFADAGVMLVVLVAVVVASVTAALLLAPPRYRPALGVILGGAVGNLVDRLRFGGAVVDFIGLYGWPSFNLADAAIAAGTVVLVLQVLRASRA